MMVGDGGSQGPARRPRSARELLGDLAFGVIFWARLVLLTSVWAFIMTTVILAFEFGGSATWAGVVAAAQMLPQFVFTLPGGRWSDRYGAFPLILIGTTVLGTGVLGLVLWLALAPGGGLPGVVALVVTSLLFGSGLALVTPALQAIVPTLVRTEELATAAGLSFVPTTLARAVGPLVGAWLLGLLGPPGTFLVIGGVIVATLFSYLPVRRRLRGVESRRASSGGWRAVFSRIGGDRILVTSVIGVAVIGAAAEAAITLAPVLAVELGESSTGGGLLTTGFGLGGLLGILVLGLVRGIGTPSTQGGVAMVLMGLAVVAAALAGSMSAPTASAAGSGTSLLVVTALLTLGGAGMVAGVTAFSTALQIHCPPDMLGRIMAVWVLAFSGIRPPAALALGVIADGLSSIAALAISGLLPLAAGIALYLIVRHRPGEIATH